MAAIFLRGPQIRLQIEAITQYEADIMAARVQASKEIMGWSITNITVRTDDGQYINHEIEPTKHIGDVITIFNGLGHESSFHFVAEYGLRSDYVHSE